jgi:hypothetical protein
MKAAGSTDRETARRTGVPVNTIRTWRNRQVPLYARPSPTGARGFGVHELASFDRAAVPGEPYAYLLGVYLGDGCLTPNGSSWSLRITLDAVYPGIVGHVSNAIEAIVGRRPACRERRGYRCVEVGSTWRPWICLFPQHGPGRKHHRAIRLADWQQEIVDAAPKPFLRGLIHTDGWRGFNRVHVKGRDYAYPRYQFSNRSDDIRQLFTDTCDKLGVEWRPWTRYHISVARWESVALLDSFIGPKA